jgi:hypothetical protein
MTLPSALGRPAPGSPAPGSPAPEWPAPEWLAPGRPASLPIKIPGGR